MTVAQSSLSSLFENIHNAFHLSPLENPPEELLGPLVYGVFKDLFR